MTKESILRWVRKNREQIDATIRSENKSQKHRISDYERVLWVRNHESLYRWARSEGVEV
jgi:hypothetical protein